MDCYDKEMDAAIDAMVADEHQRLVKRAEYLATHHEDLAAYDGSVLKAEIGRNTIGTLDSTKERLRMILRQYAPKEATEMVVEVTTLAIVYDLARKVRPLYEALHRPEVSS